jgi:hypothetical protein
MLLAEMDFGVIEWSAVGAWLLVACIVIEAAKYRRK